jgi:putative transposase
LRRNERSAILPSFPNSVGERTSRETPFRALPAAIAFSFPATTSRSTIAGMRTRYRIFDTAKPHFMTVTVNGWLPVFTKPETVVIVLESWRYLIKNDSFLLYAYVILENHIHLIASAPDLANVMKRFKMFTARKIIDLLKERNSATLLRHFQALKRDHKTQSDYQLWEEGFHPQEITVDEMMRQKVEYIHLNPVKRGYVDDPTHWRSSSARNYAGQPGLIDVVTDW